jgi:hypothetical protein
MSDIYIKSTPAATASYVCFPTIFLLLYAEKSDPRFNATVNNTTNLHVHIYYTLGMHMYV